MGASAKRKKEKQKDFLKPKLRVGKTKAKPDSFTNTSFRSKAIIVAGQSLHTSTPSTTYLFTHHISLLSHHSSTTRKESLSYLKAHLPVALDSSSPSNLPTTSSIITALLPLILDPSAGVRSQLLLLLKCLPDAHLAMHVPKILLFVNSAMTHISGEIRADSTKFLEWLLDVHGSGLDGSEEAFAGGGWGMCVRGVTGCLGFAAGKVIVPKVRDVKVTLGHLRVLKKVLERGLLEVELDGRRLEVVEGRPDGLHISYAAHRLPDRSNGYAFLGLFSVSAVGGDVQETEPEDRDSRVRYLVSGPGRGVFDALVVGLGKLKKDGGEVGRAAGKTLAVFPMVQDTRC